MKRTYSNSCQVCGKLLPLPQSFTCSKECNSAQSGKEPSFRSATFRAAVSGTIADLKRRMRADAL